MGLVTARRAISDHWNTQAESLQPTVERFGRNRSPSPDFTQPWWALDIVEGEAFQIGVSPVIFRRVGLVYVSIYVPANSGAKLLDTLSEDARAIWEGVTLTTSDTRYLKFTGAEPQAVRTGERFRQENVVTEFHFDDPAT